jgi:hypothetical protein
VTYNHSIPDVVRGYYHAWTSGNLTYARTFLCDALDFEGSIDTFHSANQLIAALQGFHRMLKSVRLLKEFYSQDGAMLLYDCIMDFGTIRTAEYLGVTEGKISEIRAVFDATELRKMNS